MPGVRARGISVWHASATSPRHDERMRIVVRSGGEDEEFDVTKAQLGQSLVKIADGIRLHHHKGPEPPP